MFVPEVVEGCRVDLLSEHISYSCIGEDVRVEQRQTQSQQPEAQGHMLQTSSLHKHSVHYLCVCFMYLNRGPMAATWRLRLLLAPPTLRDSERCSKLPKIST